MVLRKFRFLTIFLLLFVVTSNLEIDRGDIISLYSAKDKVVDLTDDNLTQTIYNSQHVWVIEFYAHWCGHCQKFARVWKKIAEEMHDWKDIVRIGAINCAQQVTCNNFNIRGTPTIRVFFPRIKSGLGIEIPHNMDVSFNRGEILKSIEVVQSHQLMPSINRKNLLPYASMDLGSIVSEAAPATKVVFILEDLMNPYGREIVFLANKKFTHLYVRRIDWVHASGVRNHFQSGQLPAVLVLDIKSNDLDWNNMMVFYPVTSSATETMTDQVIQFLESVNNNQVEATTSLPTTTEAALSTTSRTFMGTQKLDVIHASDLERSIQYALTVEIPTQHFLDEMKMKTIYQYLEIITRYLPLRESVLKFLHALREWPIRMDLRALKSSDFKAKVEELISIYQPFEVTPDEWKSCKGSEPHLRGYPCSVWTLFHTLLVNAAIVGDPAMAVGGRSTVAKVMVNYIHHFFSCRPCAENFSSKVTQLGFLPTTPQDSILWLWQIHNMANIILKGDASEDPEHPKIVWPSQENCPNCRAQTTWFSTPDFPVVQAQGENWNVKATTDYLIKVYRSENIVQNSNDTKVNKVEVLQKLMEDTMSKIESEEGRMNLDIKSLVAINQYCAKAYSLVKN